MNIKKIISIICCILYGITVLIVLPLTIYERNQHYSSKVEAWFIGGIFVMATLPISMLGNYLFLEHVKRAKFRTFL
jgi:hypothetical protein